MCELLDARGLRCPLPVRMLARALALLPDAGEVELLGDDPLMPLDVEAYCLEHGHQATRLERIGSQAHYRVCRGPRAGTALDVPASDC